MLRPAPCRAAVTLLAWLAVASGLRPCAVLRPIRSTVLHAPCARAAVVRAQAEVEGVRVNKVFTSVFSRREADRVVASGRVRLNGRVATAGDRVLPGDELLLDGEPFTAVPVAAADGVGAAPAESFTYLKYWKPRGVTCTTDRRDRTNIVDALGRHDLRLFTVGRLDKDSEGLILITNDGRLVNAVSRAAQRHEKIYDVEVHRPIADTHLRQLARGVVITTTAQRDRGPPKVLTAPTRPCVVERRGRASFSITLCEGRNRQIRRMCTAIGFTVTRLHRRRVMDIGLEGLSGPGDSADLEGAERDTALRAIAEAEVSEAGKSEGAMETAGRGTTAAGRAPAPRPRARSPSGDYPQGSPNLRRMEAHRAGARMAPSRTRRGRGSSGSTARPPAGAPRPVHESREAWAPRRGPPARARPVGYAEGHRGGRVRSAPGDAN